MVKIAITGGTGFIGRKLAQQYLKLSDEVRYLTRADNQPIIGAKAFIGDLNSSSVKLKLFLNEVNLLVNCAGEVNNEKLMRLTHVQGTANFLKVIEQSQLQNHGRFHWVQLSSCGAYGQSSSYPFMPRHIDEETIDNPSGEYECTKTEADSLIIAFAKKHDWFKYTIIRPTIVFGVGMRSTFINRIASMIKKRFFFYVGNRDSIANFVHVDDVVKAMMLSANQPKAYNQVFIVSNDCKFSDVVSTISEVLQTPKPTWVINEFLLRNLVKLVGKWIQLPITGAQIDVMMRQTHYSNMKLSKTLDWSPSDSVLVQLKQYVNTVFNVKNG